MIMGGTKPNRTEEDGLIVKLIWTNWEISPNTRKSLKNGIVQKFCGKLVIGHRRESGGVIVMNDVVSQLKEGIDMDRFKATLAQSHVRGLGIMEDAGLCAVHATC